MTFRFEMTSKEQDGFKDYQEKEVVVY